MLKDNEIKLVTKIFKSIKVKQHTNIHCIFKTALLGGCTKTCSELPVSSLPVILTGNLWRFFFRAFYYFHLLDLKSL